MPDLHFAVPGIPVPQGSMVRAKWGVRHSNENLEPWRDTVTAAAIKAAERAEWVQALGPVAVSLTFYLPRPKAHYGTGGNAGQLKTSAPHHHAKKPDVDKLARAILDALTVAAVWRDDDQVARLHATKVFADIRTGVVITVQELP